MSNQAVVLYIQTILKNTHFLKIWANFVENWPSCENLWYLRGFVSENTAIARNSIKFEIFESPYHQVKVKANPTNFFPILPKSIQINPNLKLFYYCWSNKLFEINFSGKYLLLLRNRERGLIKLINKVHTSYRLFQPV